MAYQVERQLRELGDRAPTNEKARAEQLISETRSLVKSGSPDVARLKRLTSDLQQMAYGLTAAASSAQPQQQRSRRGRKISLTRNSRMRGNGKRHGTTRRQQRCGG
jgi:molecular chaperone DnaK